MDPAKIVIKDLGQIKEAEVHFGNLTLLVGPQATGKSIFLQLLKLLVDAGSVLAEFKRFNIDWGEKSADFLEMYFGEGMSEVWNTESRVTVDGEDISLDSLTRKKKAVEKLFYIPAQRVMSLRDGLTRPFTDYRSGDPYVLREFSERLHQMIQSEFGGKPDLFPQNSRIKAELREPISEHIFGGFKLKTDAQRFQKRLALTSPNGHSLPYLVWSAGQREFVPLLLGFYWLMPPAKVSLRKSLKWVVIEEPEMGLHPCGISVVLTLILELIRRGYKVCLSTHSPHVLDVIWALRQIREHQGTERDVVELFKLQRTGPTTEMAKAALKAEAYVYYFTRDGIVKDISTLDPGAEQNEESGWGGLTEFSGHIGDVVAQVVRDEEAER